MSNKSNQQEPVEKLDVESLIVDLLACGLGAVIILFFIFSVKIIGQSTVSAQAAVAGPRDKGKGPGYVSLIGDEGDEKSRMGAVRMIELSELSEETLNVIADYMEHHGRDCWDFKHMKSDKKLFSTIHSQVQVRKNAIVFIVTADGMRQLNFSFPPAIHNRLKGETGKVIVTFLEGKSARGDFNGFLQSAPYRVKSLDALRITLRVGKITTDVGRLINVTE